jgi:hypothetical protein
MRNDGCWSAAPPEHESVVREFLAAVVQQQDVSNGSFRI